MYKTAFEDVNSVNLLDEIYSFSVKWKCMVIL